MMRRWMIKRDTVNSDHERLMLVKVYAEDENKEVVKAENKDWTYERELIRCL